jgi:hypothetical protein
MVLRLLPPPGSGEPPKRRGKPSRALSLTDDEVRHLHAAIEGVARSYPGGKAGLARALGCVPAILSPGRKHPGPAVAVALWRLTGLPLDVILRGKLAAVPFPTPPRDPDAA